VATLLRDSGRTISDLYAHAPRVSILLTIQHLDVLC
jgi:hypothetical protein